MGPPQGPVELLSRLQNLRSSRAAAQFAYPVCPVPVAM